MKKTILLCVAFLGLILFVESATQRPIKKVVNLKYVETDTNR